MKEYLVSPVIEQTSLPEEEHKIIFDVDRQFSELARRIDHFRSAMKLLEHSDMLRAAYDAERALKKRADRTHYHEWRQQTREKGNDYLEWRQIAFRDGVQSIFYFGKNFRNTRSHIEKTAPVLFSKLDKRRYDEAGRLFNSQFPKFEAMRNAVAHVFNVDQFEKNTTNDGFEDEGLSVAPGTQTKLAGVSNGGKYSYSIAGTTVSYELNDETLQAMIAVLMEFYAAFAFVDGRLRALARLERGENPWKGAD